MKNQRILIDMVNVILICLSYEVLVQKVMVIRLNFNIWMTSRKI